MNEILELQSGQVAFISGLMAGFSVTIASQIIRSNYRGTIVDIAFLLFTTSSLLFLVALYIDVALSLRVVAKVDFSAALLAKITQVRTLGTSAATIALFVFIIAIGILGWLQSRASGIVTGVIALATVMVVWYARSMILALV